MAAWRATGKEIKTAAEVLDAMQGNLDKGDDYIAALVAATPATVRAAMREAVK